MVQSGSRVTQWHGEYWPWKSPIPPPTKRSFLAMFLILIKDSLGPPPTQIESVLGSHLDKVCS